jgi:hypothetical protein
MTPQELTRYLRNLIRYNIKFSTMIWGPPGIGKSSIVAQAAKSFALDFIDVRLSQLAPTDLRGLPVAENNLSRWYPPEFLPRSGSGIFFLDEFNMAPPAMQGMAQQLILDRKVGSYTVPDDWFIWAAGNRKEDRAAVFDMPTPVASRFIHLSVEPDFESFKSYAIDSKIHEQILSFLAVRTNLLHQINPQEPTWPSPRTWMMASQLHQVGLNIAPAVGEGPASEFATFLKIYETIPDLDLILAGKGDKFPFPTKEPSASYATIIGLVLRFTDGYAAYHALRWLVENAGDEWIQFFSISALPRLEKNGWIGIFAKSAYEDSKVKPHIDKLAELTIDSEE